MSRCLTSAAALAALSLLVSGCAKPSQTTTTTSTVAVAPLPAPRAGGIAVSPSYAAGAASLATGPGVTGDTSQTAALSAPANANGTTPSRGVVPSPSR